MSIRKAYSIFIALTFLLNPFLSSFLGQVAQAGSATSPQSAVLTEAVAEPANQPTMLVAFTPNTSEADRDALLERFNAELVHWIPELNMAEVRLLGLDDQVTASSVNQVAMIRAMQEEPAIDFVEGNGVVRGTYMPNDPAFAINNQSYAQELIHLEEAWNFTKGREDVIIAILDTGISGSHPDLTNQLVGGYNFVADQPDPTDDNGHGTHVAGIIGAQMDNEQGGAGVCPKCKLMPVKVLDEFNVGLWSVIIQGIIFATDQGADVINLSLGSTEQSTAVERAVQYAQDQGVFLVAAAGNSRSQEYFYPAAYAGVLSVAATDNNDQEWALSNRGDFIDIAAPGYLIFSSSISDEPYAYMTGTSMASPFVAGLAGLLLSQSPQRTAADLTDLILYSATDLGEPGWDPIFGFGRIDAYAALNSAQGASQPTPLRDGITPALFLPLISQ